MFAMLGNIRFDAVRNGVTDINHSKSVRYASHEVFKKKPRLQKIAQNADDLSITVNLHRKSGNVQGRLDALTKMMNDQKPVSFMMGNGRMVGNFVIDSLNESIRVTDDVGATIEVSVYIYLREYSGEMEKLGSLPGLVGSAMGAIGSVTANINNAIGKVQDIYDQIMDAVGIGQSMLGIAYSVQDMVDDLRGANDGIQILNNMTPFLSEGIANGEALQQNAEGWNEEETAQFGDFLSAATAMLESFEQANEIAEASIATGEITQINEMEAVGNNLACQSQTLNIERSNVICDVGMRNF